MTNPTDNTWKIARLSTAKASLAATGLAALVLLSPNQSQALQITYDLRINAAQSPGLVIDPLDSKHIVSYGGPGSVIAFDLFLQLNGADNNSANDGLLQAYGSFVSTGSLLGTFRGDQGTTATQLSNVDPFKGGISQSGFQADLDGDTDLDVGQLATTGPASGTPWFIAIGNGNAVQFPVSGAGNATEFLIGRTTFTLGANALSSQSAAFKFVPRIKTDGLAAQKTLHKFTLDGAAFSITGDNSQLAVGRDVGPMIPEPATFGMVFLGAMYLVGFRRLGLKRA